MKSNSLSQCIVFVVAPVIGLGNLVSARSGCKLSPHACSPFRFIASPALWRYSVALVPQQGYLSRYSSSSSPRVNDPPAVYGFATLRSNCATARAASGLRSCALCIIFNFWNVCWNCWSVSGLLSQRSVEGSKLLSVCFQIPRREFCWLYKRCIYAHLHCIPSYRQ